MALKVIITSEYLFIPTESFLLHICIKLHIFVVLFQKLLIARNKLIA